MNYASALIVMIIQFVSQTFQIKFANNNFQIRKEGEKIHVQTASGVDAVNVPQFFDLPVIIKHFYLDARPIKMKVLNYSYSQVVKNVDVENTPSPMPFTVKNTATYKYPGEGIRIYYPAYLADVRRENDRFVANVIVFPFRYDKGKRTLFRLDSCTVQFELSPPGLTMNKGKEKPLYLIVSTNSIIHGFDSLALWKRQKGYRVKLITMEHIVTSYSGSDDAEKLRNALKEYYADSGLVYVLLGGDVDKIPARVVYAMTCEAHFADDEDSIRADLYYSDLDGTWNYDGDTVYGEVEDSVDLYPDIYVGRVPVDSIDEARDFSRKLINYEQNPTPLAENALFFAQILWQDPYTNSGESKDYIDTTFMPQYYNITKLYEASGNETYESVTSALKEGQGIINHAGHGWWTGMWLNGSPHWEYIDTCTADTLEMAFGGVLYSIGCWVGAFDREDAISEHFILNPDGPVAMIANSRYGWGSPGNPLYGYSDKFDHNFYSKIFLDSIFHVGVALSEDKADYVPLSHWKNVYRWHQYQLNLFGDPEMEIHTGYEGAVLTDFPDSIAPGSIVSFSVYDAEGDMLGGAKMSLSYEDSVYVTNQTGFSGISSIHIPKNTPDSMLLMIYARNHTAYTKWVYCKTSVYAENFEVLGNESANYFFPEETGLIRVNLRNMTQDTLSDFYVKLRCVNLSISQDSFYIQDTVLPDSSFSLSSGFTVPSYVKEGDSVLLTVETRWNIRTFTRYIEKPHVVLKPITPSSLSIGSDDTFGLILINTFSYSLPDVVVRIHSNSGIIPYQDSIIVGTLPVNDSVFVTFDGYVSDSFVSIEYRVENNAFLNDTVSILYGPNPGNYLFDFESPLSGFYITGNWQRVSTRSHSGSYSIWCGNAGHYENNANDTLITPYLKTAYNSVLSFYMWYDAAIYGSDGVHVYYYVNDSWQELDYIGSGGALDNKGIVVGWAEYRYPLKDLAYGDSTRVMFVFTTDDSVTAEGFYIDDISLRSVGYSDTGEKNYEDFYINIPTVVRGKMLSFTYNLRSAPGVNLYDIEGRKVLSFNLKYKTGRAVLNIGSLRSGLYFIVISQKNEKFVKKVVVQR